MLNRILDSIADAGRDLFQRYVGSERSHRQDLLALCQALLSHQGEALGTALAREVVAAYQQCDDTEQLHFLQVVTEHFQLNETLARDHARQFAERGDATSLAELRRALRPPVATLFERINMAPGGTATLVAMRTLLLKHSDHKGLQALEQQLAEQLIGWFNRGFLTLEEISWRSPALILEKLIAYEAVHAMQGWDDLRRRLAPDRRCFAFFHPALPEEPLIFVEVALTEGLADSVQHLLETPAPARLGRQADTAIFYSISNCQPGLKGISFGNFLIKQVVLELQRELPQLQQFATLSPVPGFNRWLSKVISGEAQPALSEAEQEALKGWSASDWREDAEKCERFAAVLPRLCARYLSQAKRGALPLDSVARFHLGNGARLERINWMGDRSANGMRQSSGMLVNYLYDLDQVEANHEAYVHEGEVACSAAVVKLMKKRSLS